MLKRIIDLVFENRLLVVLFFVMCTGLGVWRMLHTAVDAFPDTTPVQVQINAVAPALNPAEIEQQITLPLELAISGLPGLVNVRSISKFGFAQVVATLMYFFRIRFQDRVRQRFAGNDLVLAAVCLQTADGCDEHGGGA